MLTPRSKEWWEKFLKDAPEEPEVPFGILAISPELLAKLPKEMQDIILGKNKEET